MGQTISGFWNKLFGIESVRIVIIGLDAAGKTTVLYKLKLGEVVHTIPTIGFNVERVEHKNLDFQVWDIGGQDKIRPLWRHYYENTDAVIFVVDSNDSERITMARDELEKTMAFEELRNAALLVFANKQDLPKALSTKKVAKGLGLNEMNNNNGRQWYVQGASGTSGDGLVEGMDWLAQTLKQTKNRRQRR